MATFLQLCAKLAEVSGAIGAAPSSVTEQTGRQAKAVNWIADAWTEIQNERRNEWHFLRAKLEGAPLVPGTARYTSGALGIASFAEWRTPIPPSLYPSGQQDQEWELKELPYDVWRRIYAFGTHDAGRPTHYAISPARELCFGPTPDAAYLLRAEYQRAPQVLAANGDVPICPEEYHNLIVHRAHIALCMHDEAVNAMKLAQQRHDPIYRTMLNYQIDGPTTAGNRMGR